MQSIVELNAVCKSFDGGASYAVHDATFTVARGETLALVGSSGSGKSTTLKMINRLLEPTSGEIRVRGEPIARQSRVGLRRSLGYVFQGIGLFPHMTVERNVELVPRLLGWTATRRRQRGRELLDLVGLPPRDFARRYPRELSGGQQQRVGIARALAADPDCLLMDEPFGALDALTRRTLQQELLRLKVQLGKTILLVTHDMAEAELLGDRIVVFDRGRVLQIGRADELRARPADAFVAELFEASTATGERA